jgi:hypothetical protein
MPRAGLAAKPLRGYFHRWKGANVISSIAHDTPRCVIAHWSPHTRVFEPHLGPTKGADKSLAL